MFNKFFFNYHLPKIFILINVRLISLFLFLHNFFLLYNFDEAPAFERGRNVIY
ncbi:hypothetical protein O3M35_007388 [Rhynocoris fuscipes]|uniref:Photosystem II protein I n=1 Tax=Rhynocoris fuscipes TaxID=488301 RepID=A0AAW1DBS3_9HEMI